MTPEFHALTITDVRRETADAVSIAFDVPEDLKPAYAFAQGQYVTLRTMMDGEDVRRSYSICAGLDDGEIRVAVKKIDGGRFSAFANEALKEGDRIDVMTPAGRFTTPLDPDAARTYLAVAAGSGITPVLSIVKTVLAREPKAEIVLAYGNRSAETILFREVLEDLKDRYMGRCTVLHVLSREDHDVPLLSGRIDADKLKTVVGHVVPGGRVDHAFLCGPGDMVETARATLVALGVPNAAIHTERFTPAGDAPARPIHVGAAAASDPRSDAIAEIVLDGRRRVVPVADGQSIVDAARAAGVEVPYSCKGGMCCTCRARIVEGGVDMAANWSLEPWELEAGFVLTCQARPTSAKVVVDYDAM